MFSDEKYNYWIKRKQMLEEAGKSRSGAQKFLEQKSVEINEKSKVNSINK